MHVQLNAEIYWKYQLFINSRRKKTMPLNDINKLFSKGLLTELQVRHRTVRILCSYDMIEGEKVCIYFFPYDLKKTPIVH